MTRARFACVVFLALAACVPAAVHPAPAASRPPPPAEWRALTRAFFAELVAIDSSEPEGTTRAAQAMAARLRDAGLDVRVDGPRPASRNVVARLDAPHATRKPLLLVAHLDVVAARREDWSTDPFALVEKDGFFYGRGTVDDKAMAAIFVATLVRMHRAGLAADRDVIVLLTQDEEDGDEDGVAWLLAHHRDWIDGELALNEGGGGELRHGRKLVNEVQASEKTYATFVLETTSPGGHSSQPGHGDNAIYRLARALEKVAALTFAMRTNEVTRAYFARMAAIEGGAVGDEMRRVAAEGPLDTEAATRLAAASSYWDAMLRTTCVATTAEAGHAENALPQRARATVNCRILPGDAIDDVRAKIMEVVADPAVQVTLRGSPVASPVSPLSPALMDPIERITAQTWPGVVVVPIMSPSATDSKYLRAAGIPSYGVSGLFEDVDDVREHGKDERIAVDDFDHGADFLFALVCALSQ